jgi:hypothetical protein
LLLPSALLSGNHRTAIPLARKLKLGCEEDWWVPSRGHATLEGAHISPLNLTPLLRSSRKRAAKGELSVHLHLEQIPFSPIHIFFCTQEHPGTEEVSGGGYKSQMPGLDSRENKTRYPSCESAVIIRPELQQ